MGSSGLLQTGGWNLQPGFSRVDLPWRHGASTEGELMSDLAAIAIAAACFAVVYLILWVLERV
jgi:hypothetical protein